MNVRVESLGCRLNVAEMEAFGWQLADRGHRLVGPGEPAALVVVNSCAVTLSAMRKTRRLLAQLRRDHPAATLVVTGCHAELAPGEIAAAGARLVVGNAGKDALLAALEEGGLVGGDDVSAGERPSWPFAAGGRTRAFVKVQDGCENRCAFCIVARLRGAERSRPLPGLLEEIRQLVRRGYREIVLTGVHLASYGRDAGMPGGLRDLVARILAETELPRMRLSSLEPWDLGPSFFELFADPRLLPHLHLPLQSGCAGTLRRMRRGTTPRAFAELVGRARAAAPGLAVSTDVIVGFPGETEEEDAQSAEFVEAMAFSRLHVFRYSPRPGTAAAALPSEVPGAVAVQRSRRMHRLAARMERAYQERHLGARADVLFESGEPSPAGTRYHGLTPNYLRVVVDVPGQVRLRNRTLPVRLDALEPGALRGALLEAAS